MTKDERRRQAEFVALWESLPEAEAMMYLQWMRATLAREQRLKAARDGTAIPPILRLMKARPHG
jgi:hypothetical protein